MEHQIVKLSTENFEKCSNIWNMEKHRPLAERFYRELLSGNRTTYVYTLRGEYIAEISLVLDMNDRDYTIPGKRAYVSRLIVKPDYRRRGIGKALVGFIADRAAQLGLSELSIGVDTDNYPALRLYAQCGFDRIIYVGEDTQGRYIKLLRKT